MRWCAAAALAACTATHGRAVLPVLSVTLATRGVDAPVHRIPALALTTRGTLITAWEFARVPLCAIGRC